MMFAFALSGLQEFLYDLSPTTPAREDRAREGGRETYAARRLRVRSAILTLVPAVVAWQLKQKDPNAKVAYLGGGKLMIQVSAEAVEALKPLLVELYHWLTTASAGKLGAHWCEVPGDLSAETMQSLLDALGIAKWRSGRFDVWNTGAGVIQQNSPVGFLGDRNWESQTGSEFARREDYQGFKVQKGSWQIGPWSVQPVTSGPDIVLAGKAAGELEVSIPTHSPKNQNGDVLELFKLAEQGEGASYLALLKLDGDGIGSLVSASLDKGLDSYASISTQLKGFFGKDLMQWLAEVHPNLYLVYSGGDDLVLTGHFVQVLKAAQEIEERYRKQNLGTVSAGISFYSRQSSILKAVEAAEWELTHAKQTRAAISVGGCCFDWHTFAKMRQEVNGLVKAEADGAINRGAFQLLKQLGAAWLSDAPAQEQQVKFRSIPQFHYMRSRRQGWKEAAWRPEMKQLFDSLAESDCDWPRAALVGNLAGWQTKTKEEHEQLQSNQG